MYLFHAHHSWEKIYAGCCFVIMVVATIFSVQIMAFVQMETPQHLVGKVISVCMMLSMCARANAAHNTAGRQRALRIAIQPVGQ